MLLFAQACKKDPANFEGFDTAFRNEYQPLKANSQWLYVVFSEGFDDNGQPVSDTVLAQTVLTGQTELIDNKLYYNYNVIASTDTGIRGSEIKYFGVINHTYSTRDFSRVPGQGSEILYLNDTTKVGGVWQQPFFAGDIPVNAQALLYGTVVEKDIAFSVQGTEYKNVIHTRLDIVMNTDGQLETYGTYNYYVARDIGIIRIDTQFADGSTQSTQLMQHAIVK